MAVRKLSVRHLRWVLTRTLVEAIPPLRRRMLFYRDVLPAEAVGHTEVIEESADNAFTPYEQALVDRLPQDVTWQPIPPRLERRVALIALPDVTLLGNTGVVVDENRERLLTYRGSRPFVTYHDFRPTILTPVARAGVPSVSMLGSWEGHRHLFHFIMDRLPKLYYALHRFALGADAPLEILVNDGLPGFQTDVYRFLTERHPNLRITTVPQTERWRFDTLHVVDTWQNTKSTLADPAVLEFIRTLYKGGYGVSDETPRRRLWVSREDTKKRRLGNEQALQPILERHGFETVMPGKLSFADQVRLFAQAEVIAGTHGAGLTNILFSPRSARVLEIFPENKLRNTYFLMSRSLGQTYRYLIAGPAGARERFEVDPAAFDQALGEIVTAPPEGH